MKFIEISTKYQLSLSVDLIISTFTISTHYELKRDIQMSEKLNF